MATFGNGQIRRRNNQVTQGNYAEVGNFNIRGADNTDPRLRSILKEAALRSGVRIEAFSGYRPGSSGEHGKGGAIDVRLYDSAGKSIPNYQTPKSFKAYQAFAEEARKVQKELHPELNDKFRWGGYFSGGKSKYGALDLMHFDTDSNGYKTGGGTWEQGLNKRQAAIWNLPTGRSTPGVSGTNSTANRSSTVNNPEPNNIGIDNSAYKRNFMGATLDYSVPNNTSNPASPNYSGNKNPAVVANNSKPRPNRLNNPTTDAMANILSSMTDLTSNQLNSSMNDSYYRPTSLFPINFGPNTEGEIGVV
jgi:hypothetical protein